jgi:hypothetical protein
VSMRLGFGSEGWQRRTNGFNQVEFRNGGPHMVCCGGFDLEAQHDPPDSQIF